MVGCVGSQHGTRLIAVEEAGSMLNLVCVLRVRVIGEKICGMDHGVLRDETGLFRHGRGYHRMRRVRVLSMERQTNALGGILVGLSGIIVGLGRIVVLKRKLNCLTRGRIWREENKGLKRGRK